MIARAADADRGVIVRDSADSVASTYDIFTGVIYLGFLANPLLQCKSRVTDADWPRCANATMSMLTTVDI
jgi:hypothetical protein